MSETYLSRVAMAPNPLSEGVDSNVTDSLSSSMTDIANSSKFPLVLFIRDASQIYVGAMSLFGLTGNCLCIAIFCCSPLRHKSPTQYLVALSAADSGFLLALALTWLKSLVGGSFRPSAAFCKGLNFLAYFCSSLSGWVIIAFTVERYIIVFYPLYRAAMCTVSRARKVIGVLMIVAACLNAWVIPVTTHNGAYCGIAPNSSATTDTILFFSVVDLVLSFWIPAVFIVGLNGAIAREIGKSSRIRQVLTLNMYQTGLEHTIVGLGAADDMPSMQNRLKENRRGEEQRRRRTNFRPTPATVLPSSPEPEPTFDEGLQAENLQAGLLPVLQKARRPASGSGSDLSRSEQQLQQQQPLETRNRGANLLPEPERTSLTGRSISDYRIANSTADKEPRRNSFRTERASYKSSCCLHPRPVGADLLTPKFSDQMSINSSPAIMPEPEPRVPSAVLHYESECVQRATRDPLLTERTLKAISNVGTASDRKLSMVQRYNERRITVLLVTVSMCYVLLNLPAYIQRLVNTIMVARGSQEFGHAIATYISQILFYTQYSVNFFLYSCQGRLYRNVACIRRALRFRKDVSTGFYRKKSSVRTFGDGFDLLAHLGLRPHTPRVSSRPPSASRSGNHRFRVAHRRSAPTFTSTTYRRGKGTTITTAGSAGTTSYRSVFRKFTLGPRRRRSREIQPADIDTWGFSSLEANPAQPTCQPSTGHGIIHRKGTAPVVSNQRKVGSVDLDESHVPMHKVSLPLLQVTTDDIQVHSVGSGSRKCSGITLVSQGSYNSINRCVDSNPDQLLIDLPSSAGISASQATLSIPKKKTSILKSSNGNLAQFYTSSLDEDNKPKTRTISLAGTSSNMARAGKQVRIQTTSDGCSFVTPGNNSSFDSMSSSPFQA